MVYRGVLHPLHLYIKAHKTPRGGHVCTCTYLGHGLGGEGARRSLCLGLGVPDHLGLDAAAAFLRGRLLAEVHRGLEQPAGTEKEGT